MRDVRELVANRLDVSLRIFGMLSNPDVNEFKDMSTTGCACGAPVLGRRAVPDVGRVWVGGCSFQCFAGYFSQVNELNKTLDSRSITNRGRCACACCAAQPNSPALSRPAHRLEVFDFNKLVGVDALWNIVARAQVPEVVAAASQLLIGVHYHLNSVRCGSRSRHVRCALTAAACAAQKLDARAVYGAFISTAMTRLDQASQKGDQAARSSAIAIVKLLELFLHEVEDRVCRRAAPPPEQNAHAADRPLRADQCGGRA
jgi:hypothetical protein